MVKSKAKKTVPMTSAAGPSLGLTLCMATEVYDLISESMSAMAMLRKQSA